MHFPWKTTGHEKQKQEIESNILKSNLAHAYLFSGPKEIGKLYFAKEMAQAILCKNNMCKTCQDCREIANLSHPDFLLLDMLYIDGVNTDWEVIGKYSNINQEFRAKAPKSKTDTIGIATIREINKRLQEKALGTHRICIIRNIDRINTEATNAFLKIVEEPPKGVIFIFTTAKESALLPTLLSRLRIIRFNTLHDDKIREKIREKFGVLEKEKQILNFAQGRISRAMHLAKDQDELKSLEDDYNTLKKVYEDMTLFERFQFAESIAIDNDKLNKFFEQSYFYLRSKVGPQSTELVDTIEMLQNTEKHIQQNANKRLALEHFFMHIA